MAHVESAERLKGITVWGHLCCLFLQPYVQPSPFYRAAYGTTIIEFFILIDLTWIILLASAELIPTDWDQDWKYGPVSGGAMTSQPWGGTACFAQSVLFIPATCWRLTQAQDCFCLPWDVMQGKQVAASAHSSQASRSGLLWLVALAVFYGKQEGEGSELQCPSPGHWDAEGSRVISHRKLGLQQW